MHRKRGSWQKWMSPGRNRPDCWRYLTGARGKGRTPPASGDRQPPGGGSQGVRLIPNGRLPAGPGVHGALRDQGWVTEGTKRGTGWIAMLHRRPNYHSNAPHSMSDALTPIGKIRRLARQYNNINTYIKHIYIRNSDVLAYRVRNKSWRCPCLQPPGGSEVAHTVRSLARRQLPCQQHQRWRRTAAWPPCGRICNRRAHWAEFEGTWVKRQHSEKSVAPFTPPPNLSLGTALTTSKRGFYDAKSV